MIDRIYDAPVRLYTANSAFNAAELTTTFLPDPTGSGASGTVVFAGSPTGRHTIYITNLDTQKDNDRIAAHWQGYVEGANAEIIQQHLVKEKQARVAQIEDEQANLHQERGALDVLATDLVRQRRELDARLEAVVERQEAIRAQRRELRKEYGEITAWLRWPANQQAAPVEAPNGTCRICGKPRPQGCTVTCGGSHCQQAATDELREANRRPRRRRSA